MQHLDDNRRLPLVQSDDTRQNVLEAMCEHTNLSAYGNWITKLNISYPVGRERRSMKEMMTAKPRTN